MTRVTVIKSRGHIVSLVADGHTGYGVEGEAALSSVIQTAVLGLMRVAGINAEVETDEGYLSLELPKLNEQDRHNADMILDTMLCGIADLNEGYSDFIELEVK